MTVDRFGIHDKVEITVLSLGDNFEAGDYEFIKLPGFCETGESAEVWTRAHVKKLAVDVTESR